jgi:hypothetical protein
MMNEQPVVPTTDEHAGAERDAIVRAWQAANAVVQAHYEKGGIDAFPIYSEDAGLEKFMLTRRLACVVHKNDLPDQWGTLQLTGDSAPRYDRGEKSIVPLDASGLLAEFDGVDEPLDGHERCWHRYASQYPRIYQAVTDLVTEYPQVSAAREIYVDKEFVDGTYHPLYLHAFVQDPMMVYDWFAIEADDYAVFIKITGEASIFRSDVGTWRFVGAIMKEATTDELKAQFREWLHLS